MDNIDKASQLEEVQRKAAIDKAKSKAAGDSASLKECFICGDEIPIARRKAVKGCKTCFPCQREAEK